MLACTLLLLIEIETTMSQRPPSSAEHPTSLSRRSPTRRRTLFEDLLGRPPEEEAHRVLASLQRRSAAALPADQVRCAIRCGNHQPRQTLARGQPR